MRVALLPKSGIQPVWLAGQPGVDERTFSSVSNLSIEGAIAIQEDDFIRSISTDVIDRGNHGQTVTFSTVREFATASAAELWAMDYDQTQPRTGIVEFQSVIPGGQVANRRMIDAVVLPPRRKIIGCSVLLDYTIKGKAIIT